MLKPLRTPSFLFIVINIMMFSLLYYYPDEKDPKILMVGGCVLALSLITYFLLCFLNWGDKYLFIIASMLVVIGVAMLYRLNQDYGFKQILWYIFGIASFSVSYLVYKHIKFLNRFMWLYLAASVVLFAVTLIMGRSVYGATNWIVIGGLTIQPIEFIKLLFTFFLASYFSGKRNHLFKNPTTERFVIMGTVFLHLGFLILQREWGSILLFFFTYLLLFFIYDGNWLIMTLNSALMVVVGFLGYHTMHHIQVRVANWINPWADVQDKGYQITQSLFAIAAGSFFGTGIGLGKPTFIPQVHSDFIFSAVCEEMGIFGGIAVILLFFLLAYRGFKIALRLEGFDKCVALGITIMFSVQTFIIIGGVIKLIPLTGITLPFISYGGSSLLSSFISLGILQAISAKAGDEIES